MRHRRVVQTIPLLVLLGMEIAADSTLAGSVPGVREVFGKLPLRFEANRGQAGDPVRFLARRSGYTVFLTADEAVLDFEEECDRPAAVLRIRPLGANPCADVDALNELPGKTHYLVGPDPRGWHTDVAGFARVRYREVYPGVDLVYYGNERRLEHDFIVAPGADPEAIVLELCGAGEAQVDSHGDLILRPGGRDVRFRRPLAFQEVDGAKTEIDARYLITEHAGRHHLRFEIDHHDASRPLVIDPILVYSTFLGGNDSEAVQDIAVDAEGNAYVTGGTRSADFPVPHPANNSSVAFVMKVAPGGTSLVYATYLAGAAFSSSEEGRGIAVDSGGRAFVTGSTGSSDFPFVRGFQSHPGGFQAQGFITVLSPDGSVPEYSTYLGGSFGCEPQSIAVDANGFGYVTGTNFSSSGFPTTPDAYSTAANSLFVTKLDHRASGAASLVYSTFFGGALTISGDAIAVDGRGVAWVTGLTRANDMPTRNGFQTTHGSGFAGFDAFVAGFDPSRPGDAGLVYSSYLGGAHHENLGVLHGGIAVDSAGAVYVTGYTTSDNFPVTPDAFQPQRPGFADAFLTKIVPSRRGAASLAYSTYLGSPANDTPYDIATDRFGNVYVTGAASPGFPTTPNALPYAGQGDVFVTVMNLDCSSLIFSSFLGGAISGELGYAIAADAMGDAYVGGSTGSPDFPVRPAGGAIDGQIGALGDGFLSKLSITEALRLEPDTPTLVTLPPNARGRFFKIHPPPGIVAVIELTDPDPDDANSLHLSWDAVPCPGRSDLVASARGEANQTLVVPWTRDQEAWMLVQANDLNGDPNEVTLLLRFEDLLLEEISATYSGRGGTGRLSAAVTGGGFTADVAFRLVLPGEGGHELLAFETTVVSTRRAEVVFELSGAPEGLYDLVAEVPGLDPATLPGAFRVVATTAGPRLQVRLAGVGTYRHDRVARLTLEYENAGDEEITAPLFKLTGPPETKLWLEGSQTPVGNALLCLGIHPSGVPGKLPPGGSGALTIAFQSTHCLACPIEFQVFLLTAMEHDSVDWASLPAPNGISAEDWGRAGPAFAASLGTSWKAFHDSLAALATLLARRGILATSVDELFRVALRDALDGATSAVLGRVTFAGTAIPVEGETVIACGGGPPCEAGAAALRALTDRDGYYVLDCLQAGITHEIGLAHLDLVSTRTGSTSVAIPDRGDVLLFDILAGPGPEGAGPADSRCDQEGAPTSSVVPPAELFTQVAGFPVNIVSSIDPNDKNGPGELEVPDLRPRPALPVAAGERLHYTIYFENDAAATASAHTVEVTDWLDPTIFDVESIELGSVTIGRIAQQSAAFTRASSSLYLEAGDLATGTIYSSQLKLAVNQVPSGGEPAELAVGAHVDLGLDPTCQAECEPGCDPACEPENGGRVKLQWTINTLSSDPLDGFLLKNDGKGQGEGSVSFSVETLTTLEHDTEFENAARIVFDGLAPINTQPWRNRIELSPQAPFFPIPGNGRVGVPLDLVLQWGPPPDHGETYDVFLWAGTGDPAGPVAVGVTHLRLGDLGFVAPGTPYRWKVRARNPRGSETSAEWSFTTFARFRRGDANGDGSIDIADPIFSLFLQFTVFAPEAVCRDALDFDDSGEVEITDPIATLGFLFLAGPPPQPPGLEVCGPDPTLDSAGDLGCSGYVDAGCR